MQYTDRISSPVTLTVVLTGPKTKNRNLSKPVYDMEPLCGEALFASVAVVQNIAVVGQLMGKIWPEQRPGLV